MIQSQICLHMQFDTIRPPYLYAQKSDCISKELCVCVCVCVWGGGGTPISSYLRRLGPFLRVFRKMSIFGGMKILWILGGGGGGDWTIYGVISMYFRVFY